MGWASRPSFLDGRDAHPTIIIKIVSYLIRDPKIDAAVAMSQHNPPIDGETFIAGICDRFRQVRESKLGYTN